MGKLMVGVRRFLFLCAVVLALPSVAASQCISQLAVQRVWTQAAGGTEKTTFAPGETIQFAAELNNSYGAYMLAAYGAQLAITTSFYSTGNPVDIPGGLSTWTWDTTALSEEGDYTVAISAFDHHCGVWVEGSGSFAIGQFSPPPTPLTFDVPATAQWVDTGLDVVAGDLLEVSAVGTWTDGGATSGPEGFANPWPDNFLNLTDLGACSTCARTLTEGHGALIGYIGDSPPAAGSYTSTAVQSEAVKVFYIGANFRETAPNDGRLWLNKNADAYSGYTLDNSGFVTATVTVTTGPNGSGQPPEITLLGDDPLQHIQGCPFTGAGATASDPEDGDLTDSIVITGTENLDNPGLQTLTYSVTDSSGLSDTKTRQVVVFGVIGTPGCLLGQPAGKAPNLIVYVHGCCTNAEDVGALSVQFSEAYKGQAFLQQNGGWEIVVWDWSDETEKDIDQIGDAYRNAEHQGTDLNLAISPHSYKYVHLIGHSAGARLIDKAAKDLVNLYKNVPSIENTPFIHLTFLDAYQPNNDDYGFLEGYPKDKHYAEHYVDRTESIHGPWTNSCLLNAFNFDITKWWERTPEENEHSGHAWPRHWYIRSIRSITTPPEFKYGHQLSLEGSDKDINELVNELANYPAGQQCTLVDVNTICIPDPSCW